MRLLRQTAAVCLLAALTSPAFAQFQIGNSENSRRGAAQGSDPCTTLTDACQVDSRFENESPTLVLLAVADEQPVVGAPEPVSSIPPESGISIVGAMVQLPLSGVARYVSANPLSLPTVETGTYESTVDAPASLPAHHRYPGQAIVLLD